jgi:hypothetical protein
MKLKASIYLVKKIHECREVILDVPEAASIADRTPIYKAVLTAFHDITDPEMAEHPEVEYELDDYGYELVNEQYVIKPE